MAKPVTTLEELLEAVEKAKSVLRERALRECIEGQAETEFWFRGIPRQEFKLVPSLLRIPLGLEVEPELYESYVEHRAKRRDWDALFEMQQHFIPTRLLDWTSTFGVALHFALHSDQALDKPAVWVLHPGLLNKRSLSRDQWERLRNKGSLSREMLDVLGLRYRAAYLGRSPDGADYPRSPIAITPEAAFPRLRAQRGRFTIHGADKRGLEEQCCDAVERVVIDSGNKAIETIRSWASTAVDTFSIFPDPVGLAHFLRQRYGLDRVVRTRLLIERLRTLWQHDAAILKQRHAGATEDAGAGRVAVAQVTTAGIESCCVREDFVARTEATGRLLKWIIEDPSGGVRVVAGDAGSGKTNFLVNLLVTHEIYEQQPVIWFPLFRFEPDRGLLENLSRHLQSVLGQDDSDLSVALSELLSRRGTVLILDGLDELSRTKGSEAAVKLIKQIPRESTDVPKVLVTCRDEILENLNRSGKLEGVLGEGGEPHFLLEPLSPDEFSRHPVASEVAPEVQSLLGRYPIFLRLPAIDRATKTSSQMFLSAFSGESVAGQAKLRTLGRVAREMLQRRQDFLHPETFSQLPRSETLFEHSPLQPLIRERTGDVRFFHHTIREFVLGWNVRACLMQMPSDWNFLRETSDLDYEGTEIYRVVSELGGIPDWTGVRLHCEGQSRSDWTRYNNYAWNCLEAAGMLGVPSAQRHVVLDWIHEVLSRPVDGRDDLYSFKAKYNAARCLERLHQGSPPCHWSWVVDHYRNNAQANHRVYAYAVRGFQRKRLSIDRRGPPVVMETRCPIDGEQLRFSRLLVRKIGELCEFAELSRDASYLLINLTYALIRWYQPSPESNQELLRLINGNDTLHTDEGGKRNLDLTLWMWAGLCGDRVVEKTEMRKQTGHVVIRSVGRAPAIRH